MILVWILPSNNTNRRSLRLNRAGHNAISPTVLEYLTFSITTSSPSWSCTWTLTLPTNLSWKCHTFFYRERDRANLARQHCWLWCNLQMSNSVPVTDWENSYIMTFCTLSVEDIPKFWSWSFDPKLRNRLIAEIVSFLLAPFFFRLFPFQLTQASTPFSLNCIFQVYGSVRSASRRKSTTQFPFELYFWCCLLHCPPLNFFANFLTCLISNCIASGKIMTCVEMKLKEKEICPWRNAFKAKMYQTMESFHPNWVKQMAFKPGRCFS